MKQSEFGAKWLRSPRIPRYFIQSTVAFLTSGPVGSLPGRHHALFLLWQCLDFAAECRAWQDHAFWSVRDGLSGVDVGGVYRAFG